MAVLPALPEMTPLPAAMPAPPLADRSNERLGTDFLELAFRMESGRAIPTFSRFETPITVALTGAIPESAPADLNRLMSRMRAEAGIDIRPAAEGARAAITVQFLPRRTMQRLVPMAACFVVPGVTDWDGYRQKRGTDTVDWARLKARTTAAIFVPSDTSPQEVRDCLHEELAQAIGPLNDLYRLPDSVFNDDNFHTVLTGFDMLMLRVYYDGALQSGMTEAEVAARLPAILSRVNPTGGMGQPARPLPTARPWVDAIEDALAPRGARAARVQAAERAVALADAAGWNDNRLAFSHFIRGRLLLSSDPATALQSLSAARRICASLPGGAVHAAHVEMQLAAHALAHGMPEAAVAHADAAIPTVRRTENAALLAMLMLIKAEAMESLGQEAAAQGLRLDSRGWARYGFGSETQVRARMDEIAALARGGEGG